MNSKLIFAFSVSGLIFAGCATPSSGGADEVRALVAKTIAGSFLPGEGQDLSRLVQDDTLKACNEYRDNPPEKAMAAIIEREKNSIRYPADGKLMGDWKTGEKYFKEGFAYRIGRVEPDNPKKDRGGNCYACHGGDPKEVAYGTIGPTLTGYGKLRGRDEAMVRYTYEKIFNAQAFVACSQMPRLGHNGILTPEKVAHITAYLLSVESPINK
jgi:sulfur-oxidizing protein SoxX